MKNIALSILVYEAIYGFPVLKVGWETNKVAWDIFKVGWDTLKFDWDIFKVGWNKIQHKLAQARFSYALKRCMGLAFFVATSLQIVCIL